MNIQDSKTKLKTNKSKKTKEEVAAYMKEYAMNHKEEKAKTNKKYYEKKKAHKAKIEAELEALQNKLSTFKELIDSK